VRGKQAQLGEELEVGRKRAQLGEELEVGGARDIKTELRKVCMRCNHQR
jgi:hypothetical protein